MLIPRLQICQDKGYQVFSNRLVFLVFDRYLPPSAVPVPAAVWLFGTALIGLVGFSKRRKAA
ncbi:VPLPA-CTERM sorting domain-containing protein [Pseudomonadota bacterium]